MREPATRQMRLSSGEPDEALADRLANYRVVRRAFLSATALASFSTCRTRPFIERVVSALGLDTSTWEMRQGIAAHEAVQGALAEVAEPSAMTFREALAAKAFLLSIEHPLRDERRLLRGIADIAFARGGEAYVLELKNTRPPPDVDERWGAAVWPEHAVQTQFYALLATPMFGRRPKIAVSYLRGGRKEAVIGQLAEGRDAEGALMDLYAQSAAIAADADSDRGISDLVRAFRASEKQFVVPAPGHADPRRCEGCRVRSWCPRRMDAPGSFDRLPAQLLEQALGADPTS